MKTIFKRVVAYIIDIVLVSLLSTMITSNSYINKDYKKYTDVYDKYSKYNEVYDDYLYDLEEIYNKDKVSKEDYGTLLNEYPDYNKYTNEILTFEKLDDDKYNDILKDIEKNYKDKSIDYSYQLIKLSVIPTIINILCILLYFVVIQYYFNGQTIGKKLMKIRVVSNNEKKLTLLNYFIRSLILNEVFINILNVFAILLFSKNNYIIYNQVIYYIAYILEMAILFMILFDKNNRGIHDFASNTKVIDLK